MGKYKEVSITEEVLSMPIGELDLSTRTVNILEKVGINTVLELFYSCAETKACCECVRQENCTAKRKLIDQVNVGKGIIEQIFEALEFEGIIRKEDSNGN